MKALKVSALLVAGACMFMLPTAANARSSYGFSISTGGPAYYPVPPVYVAPPPPPPPPPIYYSPPVYYRPYPYYRRPAPSISFSYYGR